jgi:hypothetical protein
LPRERRRGYTREETALSCWLARRERAVHADREGRAESQDLRSYLW